MDPGIVVEVGGRQAMRRIGPRPHARPVLAEECPLLGRLMRMALGPAQAVRRGEEERGPGGRVVAVEDLEEVGAGGRRAEEAPRPEAAGLGDRPGRALAVGRRPGPRRAA